MNAIELSKITIQHNFFAAKHENFAGDFKDDSKLKALGKRFNVYVSDGTSDRYTESKTHGGFDNDPVTLNHLLRNIRGKKPAKLFDDSIRKYC